LLKERLVSGHKEETCEHADIAPSRDSVLCLPGNCGTDRTLSSANLSLEGFLAPPSYSILSSSLKSSHSMTQEQSTCPPLRSALSCPSLRPFLYETVRTKASSSWSNAFFHVPKSRDATLVSAAI